MHFLDTPLHHPKAMRIPFANCMYKNATPFSILSTFCIVNDLIVLCGVNYCYLTYALVWWIFPAASYVIDHYKMPRWKWTINCKLISCTSVNVCAVANFKHTLLSKISKLFYFGGVRIVLNAIKLSKFKQLNTNIQHNNLHFILWAIGCHFKRRERKKNRARIVHFMRKHT